jgi:hypothetical protein
VTFGSGDGDTFAYDANTGRMTQYKHNVGSKSVTGNLTWNANGSLGTLGITDTYNSSNSQTCSYLYDDLARIVSANCGALWSQTFSFATDGSGGAFGNLAKSVTHPDGTALNSSYTGRATQVIDEGNGTGSVARVGQSDGLGRAHLRV